MGEMVRSDNSARSVPPPSFRPFGSPSFAVRLTAAECLNEPCRSPDQARPLGLQVAAFAIGRRQILFFNQGIAAIRQHSAHHPATLTLVSPEW